MNKKLKRIFDKCGIWIGLVIALVVILSCFWYVRNRFVSSNIDKRIETPITNLEGKHLTYLESKPGESLEILQVFRSVDRDIMGLGLMIEPAKEGEHVDEVKAHVTVFDPADETVYLDQDITAINFSSGVDMKIFFPEQFKDVRGKYFEFKLVMDAENAAKIRFVGTDDAAYAAYVSQINGAKGDMVLGMNQYIVTKEFIVPLFKGFVLLFVIMFTIFYILAFVVKLRIENVYLFCVLALGLLYTLAIIPCGVPDEAMHASTVYRMSNNVMGVAETDNPNTILKRVDDVTNGLNNDVNLKQYYNVYRNVGHGVKNDELTEGYLLETGVPMFLYAPAVAGFVIARLTGMGSVDMYFLGRLLQLLVFALFSYVAMRKMPFGKSMLFVICLLPMTLQQAASLSYDAMIMSITFLYIGVVLQMAYGQEKLSRLNIVLAVILSLALVFAKSGAYIPMVLLLFLIPKEKFGSAKKKWLFACIIIVVAVALFMFKSLVMYAGAGETSQAVSIENYSVGYILTHPKEDFYMLVGTVLYRLSFYISTMIGQSMGFMNINTTYLPIYGFFVLLLLTAIKPAGVKTEMSWKDRGWIILVILGSTALVLASMWIFITAAGSHSIEGVQGRYFLPLLPLLLILFRGEGIVTKKDLTKGVVFCTIFFHCFEFVYILATTLA